MRYSSGVRFSRAKPTGSYRVLQPSTRRVASHSDSLREARVDADYWLKAGARSMEIQERLPSGKWATVETIGSKAGHATKHRSGATFDMAKEAWDDDPSERTAERYRRIAREYHRDDMISSSALAAILAETAAYVSPTRSRSHATKPQATTASKQTSLLPPSVRVARAGLESVRKHGVKNLRYGLYRHAGDRAYQWGNFTGTPESVITSVVPNARNTASQDALVRALKWKR